MDLQHGVMERECVTEVEMRKINDHPPSMTSCCTGSVSPGPMSCPVGVSRWWCIFFTDATFMNSFIFTDSLTLLMRKHVTKKVHNSESKLYNYSNL